MPAPLIAAAVPAVLEIGRELIDRLWPDPEAASEAKVKLVELQQSGALREIELQLDEMRIEAEDRASARLREVQSGDTATPRWLAVGLVVGFFGVLGWLLVAGAPAHGGEALLVLLGALSSGFAAVLAYFFGSSSGSAQKTSMLIEEARRR